MTPSGPPGGDEVLKDAHHGSLDVWMKLLGEVTDVRQRLDRIEFYAVELVRSNGATWEDIGDLLGISRQAARQRFGEPRARRRKPSK